jgi:hypothetical protein
MQWRAEAGTIYFADRLNESSDLSGVAAAIMAAGAVAPDGRATLDFLGVPIGNSTGILKWIRMLAKLPTPLNYRNAPAWLVEQFNCIRDFLKGDVVVESVLARFYDPETDSNHVVCLRLGHELPFLESYVGFDPGCKTADGRRLAPDFDETYFSFVSANCAQLRRIVP